MSAPAIAGGPVLTIRGTPYPVLLPKYRDPRLHLAAVIITLQVLGQTAFGFNLSIAQILIAIGTCGVLEVGIAFFRQHVIMWPASALLTGNGVAFILRVPGTPHGDWWSLHGAWIFAATAAVSLLSKHVIRWRGRHIFNPSNFGLVLCFLVLGENRAEPLDFWWGPMSIWLALAIALIVLGGLTILSRLRLLVIAGGFWLAFAAGIAVVAASGHSMTARWHLGPITGWSFWWLLVTSPEILIFLFFMITDPMTIPKGRVARVVYAVSVGLLATLLIAPRTTEYATKVSVLAALALVCLARPLLERFLPVPGSQEDRAWPWARGLMRHGWVSPAALMLGAAGFAGLVVVAGIPARPDGATASSLPGGEPLPQVNVVATEGVSARVDSATADQIARDIVLDLHANSAALRLRDPQRASTGAGGAWLVDLRQQIGAAAGSAISVPTYRVSRVDLTLARGEGQGPPRILAAISGTQQAADYRGRPPKLVRRHAPVSFKQSLEVALQQGHYVIVRVGGATSAAAPPPERSLVVRATGPLADVRLQDVAPQVGLDFRHGAFRFGVSNDVTAMMGGGVCWLDYDNDGWLDLFVVNSFSTADRSRWENEGGLPRSALFHNVRGSFVNVSRQSAADLAVRGEGCVAADFNGDGYTDLLVTTATYDKLLWNNGDGTFTEGAKPAGIDSFGWHTGAAVADVNGDGRPDLFVAGYTDLNSPVTTAVSGFPSNYKGVRDLLYLNEGNDMHGHATFREVGVQAGVEATSFRHGLGALFTDYSGDGRPDLYVANDEDPNQLYENVPWPGGAAADPAGLGFRFVERGAAEGVDDPYAGMGIASGDYNGDGRLDLFVTNSRREPYALLRRRAGSKGPAFREARSALRTAYAGAAGWGAAWVDLAGKGTLDLALANGDIPVTSLAKDAGRTRVLSDRASTKFANIGITGLSRAPRVNGRGLAAADYDNNGTVDIAVGSIGGRLVLLRNSGGAGHWLEVKPAGFSPGAVATVVLPDGRRLVQELHAGSSYLSSEDPRFHFGLGDAAEARTLVVRFPGVGERRLEHVRADRLIVVQPPARPPAGVAPPPSSYVRSNCSPAATPGRSVARIWDEAALALEPANAGPALQARNLFHLSAAMWDAWVAYEPKGSGYFLREKHRAADVRSAQETAISYAAYRLLLWRASYGVDVGPAFRRLTATLRSLCYRPGFVSTRGDSAAALGNRIAAAAIAFGQHDGSLEREHYVDSSYAPVNEPLVVSQPGTVMHDGTFWQPLAFARIAVKGGLPVAAKVQSFVDSQWGRVRGFAAPAAKDGLPIDPGAPPLGNSSSAAYKQAALNVIRWSSRRGGAAIAARWNGPDSAPARWNAIANALPDSKQRLARDVKLYFALNGALHDAAVATWGTKRKYQSVRPISMIRQLAFEGRLPLVPGFVELITKASSAPGRRHAALAGHVGDIAVRTAHGWTLGTRWLPRAGIVTPPYPGWVSDGSAFGRAAAAVLTAETGRARYRHIADEEGLSGLYAGTQTAADDIAGRGLGSKVGKQAWALAERYFAGTVR
ncbi:MAG TPA: FG-GAP-like repeat-containing protein [Gaiellaceae bacterium]|nr:FG-GAP-like repeat-containing protein [Gaiellaceae bacterium]